MFHPVYIRYLPTIPTLSTWPEQIGDGCALARRPFASGSRFRTEWPHVIPRETTRKKETATNKWSHSVPKRNGTSFRMYPEQRKEQFFCTNCSLAFELLIASDDPTISRYSSWLDEYLSVSCSCKVDISKGVAGRLVSK